MKYRFLLLLISCLSFTASFTQELPHMSANKRSDLIAAQSLLINVADGMSFIRKYQKNILSYTLYGNNVLLVLKHVEFVDSLINDKDVQFIAAARKPKEESVINGFDLSVNKANLSQSLFPDVNGTETHVSVKERMPDTTDPDYRDRYIKTTAAATVLNSHATIMSTIAVGAGNTHYTGKGVAPKANVSSASYDNLLPESNAFYQQNNITVQNHSYGTGVENFYGADANAYDNTTTVIPYLLHSFSSGNSGDQTSSSGKYAGIAGFANLTGSFKQSKNTISTGSVDSFYNIAALSSKGPAYDGRVKPELVAFGEDGSSGAAALVSGSALLIEHAYKQQTNQLPDAALTKAILINSADDVGRAHVDFESGFGSLNTYKAVQTIKENRILSGTVSNSTSSTFNLTVPANIAKLKITVCWNDIPASANASKALVNDLDAELLNLTTAEKWLPWVLSSFPHKDSLAALAVRKKDTLNTAEQITIENPASGTYQLTVKGSSVTGSQKFYVAYQFDTAGLFTFTYPTKADNLQPGTAHVIRWNSSFPPSTAANLQISYNEGASWQTLGTADLSKPFIKANIKDTNSLGLLRMQINNINYVSDTFSVSSKPDVKVGLNCSDSALLYWNRLQGVSQYQLYKLQNGSMVPFAYTNDTSIVLKNVSEKIIAVAPVLKTRSGYRSFALNYTTQGVSCYINNFLVDRIDSASVELKATLGSITGIKSVVFEKIKGPDVTVLKTYGNISSNFYSTIDASLSQGVNTYRVRIELQNGGIIYSQLVSIYQLNSTKYLFYPNPVSRHQSLKLISADYEGRTLAVYNVSGQQVLVQKLTTDVQAIRIAHLPAGVYTYKILYNGSREAEGKFMVQ